MNNNIRAIRQIKGYTQKELANHLDVSIQMISAWEKNPNEKIPDSRKREIAKFLGVSIEELFAPEFDEQQFKIRAMAEEMEHLQRQRSPYAAFENKMKTSELEGWITKIEGNKVQDLFQGEIKELITLEAMLPANRLALLYRFCLLLKQTHAFSSVLRDVEQLITLLEDGNEAQIQLIGTVVDCMVNKGSALTYGANHSSVDADIRNELITLLKKHRLI